MEATSNLLLKDPSKFSKSFSFSTFVIDTTDGDPIKQVEPSQQRYVRTLSLNKNQEDERSILGFQNCEKVDRNSSAALPLITTAILLDDRSSS